MSEQVTAPVFYVRLLGGLSVHDREAPSSPITKFRTRKGAALFGYLCLFADRSHPREKLGGLFWQDAGTAAASKSIGTELSSLRSFLGAPHNSPRDVFAEDQGLLSIRPGAITTDVQEFERLLAEAAKADSPAGRRGKLAAAVAIYQEGGELLPGHDETAIALERGRLALMHQEAVAELAGLYQALGDPSAAARLALEACRVDPESVELRSIAREALIESGVSPSVLPLPLLDLEAEEALVLRLLEKLRDRAKRRGSPDSALPFPSLKFRAVAEAAIKYLRPEPRRALCRFAVFEAAFTARQAAHICQEPQAERLLDGFAREGLANADKGGDDGETRYRLLSSVRQAALGELSPQERQRLSRRHCVYFLRFLKRVSADERHAPINGNALRSRELAHLRQALAWSLGYSGSVTLGVWLLLFLRPLLAEAGSREEWREWAGKCVAAAEAAGDRLTAPLQRAAYDTAYMVAVTSGDREAAQSYLERSQENLRRRGDAGFSPPRRVAHNRALNRSWHLIEAAVQAHHGEEFDRALATFDEAILLLGRHGIGFDAGYALGPKGDTLLYLGDPDGAMACYAAAFAAFQESLEPQHRAGHFFRIGGVAHHRGDYALARRHTNEALRLNRSRGAEGAVADCLRRIGVMHAEQGYFAEAELALEQCRDALRKLGQDAARAAVSGSLGDAALWQGDVERAAALYEEGLTFWEGQGHHGWTGLFLVRLGHAALSSGKLTKALRLARKALPRCDRARSPLRRATVRCLLGRILTVHGRMPGDVRRHLEESLALRESAKYPFGICQSWEALGDFWTRQGEAEVGAHYLTRAGVLRDRLGTPLPPVEYSRPAVTAAVKTAGGGPRRPGQNGAV